MPRLKGQGFVWPWLPFSQFWSLGAPNLIWLVCGADKSRIPVPMYHTPSHLLCFSVINYITICLALNRRSNLGKNQDYLSSTILLLFCIWWKLVIQLLLISYYLAYLYSRPISQTHDSGWQKTQPLNLNQSKTSPKKINIRMTIYFITLCRVVLRNLAIWKDLVRYVSKYNLCIFIQK